MNLKEYYLTKNECYITGRKHTVRGILLHSTGANNPTLKRYVNPDDGKLGVNPNNNHWNQLRPDGRQVCVHGFIGKLEDGSVATYQTLPWEMVGWHSGTGSLGSAKNANNTGYIGIEICEDKLTDAVYFNRAYKEAAEVCLYLCKKFGLTEANILCHSEGHRKGIASNHSDVMHWFPKFGKSMDTFRADIKNMLSAAKESEKRTDTASADKGLYRVQVGAFANEDYADKVAKELAEKGYQTLIKKE